MNYIFYLFIILNISEAYSFEKLYESLNAREQLVAGDDELTITQKTLDGLICIKTISENTVYECEIDISEIDSQSLYDSLNIRPSPFVANVFEKSADGLTCTIDLDIQSNQRYECFIDWAHE
ncbi:MAG: hypothetical protein H6622_15995 [Halobacteriovoraceae bacterium]|nr:hypothetical protein [Halobacteriovoraceae bacterium]